MVSLIADVYDWVLKLSPYQVPKSFWLLCAAISTILLLTSIDLDMLDMNILLMSSRAWEIFCWSEELKSFQISDPASTYLYTLTSCLRLLGLSKQAIIIFLLFILSFLLLPNPYHSFLFLHLLFSIIFLNLFLYFSLLSLHHSLVSLIFTYGSSHFSSSWISW